jgi:hypothetical protein
MRIFKELNSAQAKRERTQTQTSPVSQQKAQLPTLDLHDPGPENELKYKRVVWLKKNLWDKNVLKRSGVNLFSPAQLDLVQIIRIDLSNFCQRVGSGTEKYHYIEPNNKYPTTIYCEPTYDLRIQVNIAKSRLLGRWDKIKAALIYVATCCKVNAHKQQTQILKRRYYAQIANDGLDNFRRRGDEE